MRVCVCVCARVCVCVCVCVCVEGGPTFPVRVPRPRAGLHCARRRVHTKRVCMTHRMRVGGACAWQVRQRASPGRGGGRLVSRTRAAGARAPLRQRASWTVVTGGALGRPRWQRPRWGGPDGVGPLHLRHTHPRTHYLAACLRPHARRTHPARQASKQTVRCRLVRGGGCFVQVVVLLGAPRVRYGLGLGRHRCTREANWIGTSRDAAGDLHRSPTLH